MKNKKVLIVMIIGTVLLVTTILGIIANATGIIKIENKKIAEERNIEEIMNEEDIENDAENDAVTADNGDAQELRNASVNNIAVSSRSSIDRSLYVNTNPEMQQPAEQYDELVQYTKIEDVKISFNMDVSKTTGLSKEDFIKLVQNMRYDRTGILARNAGHIWELCHKYNVNEIFVLGICGIESAWCSAPQHQSTHNYCSLMTGGKLIAYPSDEAGFEAMISLLGQKYLTPGASLYHGATITGVGRCYCNPTSWPKKVYTCMQQVFK